jgi:hypothetical protein
VSGDVADLVARQAAELTRHAQEREERRQKLDALAVLDLMTAVSLLNRDNPSDLATAHRWDQEQRGRSVVPEIPPHSAQPELPSASIDALVSRITEVRAVLVVFGAEPPRPGPDRLSGPTPDDGTLWGQAQEWLFNLEPTVLRSAATALAGTPPGREVLRALAGRIIHSLIWRLAQILRCDIPQATPEPPSPEEWAVKKRQEAEFLESLQRQATDAPTPVTPGTATTTDAARSPSPFARLLQEEAERREREATEKVRVQELRRRLNEFRTCWLGAWGRLMNCFDIKAAYVLTDADAAGQALAEIGSLMNRLGQVREDMQQRPASQRFQSLCEDSDWWGRGAPTAATLLCEATRGTSADALAGMLRRTEADANLRAAFGWLEFFRDRLFPQEGKEHPSGFLITDEALPAVTCRVEDIDRANWYLSWLAAGTASFELRGLSGCARSLPTPNAQILPSSNVDTDPQPPAGGDDECEVEKPSANASNDVRVGPAKSPIRRAEAERLVAAAIANTPTDQRSKLTVRALNRATGVSVGMIPRLDSWQKLQDGKAGSVRSVPLPNSIHAVLNDPSADAADPAEAAADAEVLGELLALATTDADRTRFEAMTPGERWQMLELLKEQTADVRRDQRRPRRERPDRS